MERVREKEKPKKDKATSNEAPSDVISEDSPTGPVSEETLTEDVLTELQGMVTELSKSVSEKKATQPDQTQQPISEPSTSEIQKEKPIVSPIPQESPAPAVVAKAKAIDPRIKAILPPWMEKAWRWVTPDDPDLLEQWLQAWGDLVLSYSEALQVHLLKPREMTASIPFKNPLVKRQLSIEQIHSVGDDLERRQLAKWWDSKKNRLRVYWLPLDEISDLIHEWGLDGGRDVVTLFDLRNADEAWSSVPSKELRLLMETLVKTKRANWADKKQEAIEFIY
ncbi:MAG: hypothetical protein ACFFGZ_03200 [Candidatus Thorarchaeota archaeon]